MPHPLNNQITDVLSDAADLADQFARTVSLIEEVKLESVASNLKEAAADIAYTLINILDVVVSDDD